MSLRFTGTLVLSFVCLAAPSVASAQVQTFTATHTYIMGDHDNEDDAQQRCLLETKRKILEQAGVYIESASDVTDVQLTKDKITSFAAAVMQVNATEEEIGFQQGQMALTLTTTAQVNFDKVRKQLRARHLYGGVRDAVTAQQERQKRLEAKLAKQKQQQREQAPGHEPASPPSDASTAELPILQRRAAQGEVEAQLRRGWEYAFGEGVPRDYAQAHMWWGRAAAQGDVVAQTALGALYADGLGRAQDYAVARQWFEKAAAQGNAMAQVSLADMYYRGLGMPQDYRKARQWLEQAAAKGDAKAQAFLGLLYAEGQGVQDHLGRLYFFGQGGPRDIPAAREWFAKSAAQGNARAQVQLGALYELGIGVPQNDMRAYMWYSLAAERSMDACGTYAADRRDNIFSRMTSAQIAEAQNWRGSGSQIPNE